jgi:uncharacterized protein (DUF362 family)
MLQQTRRDFLRQSAALGGALALGPGLSIAEEAQSKPPEMVISHWGGATVPETEVDAMAGKLTLKAIEALGGMKRFVSKGDVVWIKPNIGWDKKPEFAANTNPEVVAALVRLCLEAGAKKVKVGDNTCNENRLTYVNSGIEAAAKAAGAEVFYLEKERYKEVALKGNYLKSWPLYPDIIETDLVINVPIAKHHVLSTATLCMKNYMGVIGGERGKWHQDVASCLCDVTAYMKPRLCVLDAVRILTHHGPQGGDLADVKRIDSIAAGVDIVALDAWGAEQLGHKPETIATVTAGAKAGLGKMDYRSLQLQELSVS